MFDIGLFFSIVAHEATSPRTIITAIVGLMTIVAIKTIVAPALAQEEASPRSRTVRRSDGRPSIPGGSNRPSLARVSAPSIFLMRLRTADPRSLSVTLVRYEQHPREARTFPVYLLGVHIEDEMVEYEFRDMEGDSPFLSGDMKRIRHLVGMTQWVGGHQPRTGERNKRGIISRPREKMLEFKEKS